MPLKSKGKAVPARFSSEPTSNLPTPRSLERSEAAQIELQAPGNSISHAPVPSFPEPASADDRLKDKKQDLSASADASEASDGSDSVGQDDGPLTARPPYTSRSHSHLPPHTSGALFPPFYNRPPTPLPPSPSLTSLLRPSFSAAASRHTTPDSSDVEVPAGPGTVSTGTSTPASTTTNLTSITNSARHAPTVLRASPKVPTYEYYGFALYLASSAAFLLYVVWAYVPSPLLHQMGIHYYPNRWWAVAVPSWLSMLVVYIYVALASYNTERLTLPLNSCENLVDDTAQMAVIERRTGSIGRAPALGTGTQHEQGAGSRRESLSAYQFDPSEDVDWKTLWSTSTDAVMDVPIGGVCEILYGGGG